MEQARLRPAQVGASTAAAVGGAFLASRLGVYGTIIGVGVITLMGTLGTEMLLRSVERTKQVAWTAQHRRRLTRGGTGERNPDKRRSVRRRLFSTAVTVGASETTGAAMTVGAPDPTVAQDRTPTTMLPDLPIVDAPAPRITRWPLVVGGFLASFGLALAVITGIESLTGRSVAGEDTPTVINVIRGTSDGDGSPPAPAPTTEASPAPTDQDGDPADTVTPSPEPTTPATDAPPAEGETPPPDGDTPPPDGETPPPDDDETPPPTEDETPTPSPTPTP